MGAGRPPPVCRDPPPHTRAACVAVTLRRWLQAAGFRRPGAPLPWPRTRRELAEAFSRPRGVWSRGGGAGGVWDVTVVALVSSATGKPGLQASSAKDEAPGAARSALGARVRGSPQPPWAPLPRRSRGRRRRAAERKAEVTCCQVAAASSPHFTAARGGVAGGASSLPTPTRRPAPGPARRAPESTPRRAHPALRAPPSRLPVPPLSPPGVQPGA